MSFELHTTRLLLRPMRLEDAEGMFELNQASDVYRNTGDSPFRDLEEAQELIRHYDQFEKYKMGRFTLIEKETKSYAGWCGLKYSEETEETDLGYRILPRFRGQGLATEASEACLEYGFAKLGLEKIIGRATQANAASIAMLKKIGMSFENLFYEHNTVCEQYCLSKKEWINLHKSKTLNKQASNNKQQIN